jgi:hypothetical protein
MASRGDALPPHIRVKRAIDLASGNNLLQNSFKDGITWYSKMEKTLEQI